MYTCASALSTTITHSFYRRIVQMFSNIFDRFGNANKQPEDEDVFFFSDTLPSMFETTSDTVQSVIELSSSQRLFLTDHTNELRTRQGELDRLRSQLMDGPHVSALVNAGKWSIYNADLTDNDAVDMIRSNPDILSDLQFQLFQPDQPSFLSAFRKFFTFSSNIDVRESSIATEVGFSLSVAEVVEIYIDTFKTIASTLANPPSIGEEAFVSRLYELKSKHRGWENSAYLLVEVRMTNRLMARDRETMALNVSTELNIYDAKIFGPDLAVVSMVKDDPAGLALSSMSRNELLDVFSEAATFLSKSNIDVVVDAETGSGASVDSKRATNVAFHATKRLVNVANISSSEFSRKVHEKRLAELKTELDEEKAELAEMAAQAEVAAQAKQQVEMQQQQAMFRNDESDDEFYDDGRLGGGGRRGGGSSTLPEREADRFLKSI